MSAKASLTLKQRRLALKPAGPKRGPPSSGRLDAACVSRRSRRDYGALCVDVALEAGAGADVKGGLVVELEGYVWLVPAAIVRVLRGGSPVRCCAVLPHWSREVDARCYVIRGILQLHLLLRLRPAHVSALILVCPAIAITGKWTSLSQAFPRSRQSRQS